MPLLTRGASIQKHFRCFNICPQNMSEMGLFKNQISTLKLVSEAILSVTYTGFSELSFSDNSEVFFLVNVLKQNNKSGPK